MSDERVDLKRQISELLLQADPMHIYFKDFANDDEYDAEAGELARRLPSCASKADCAAVVLGVFDKYFGEIHTRARPELDAVIENLWRLRQQL
jgi:hypothetical protein